jgi:pilus assembly protein Flp/PilA
VAQERRRIRRHGEAGQGLVEYAFILVLVAILLLVIVTVLGNQVGNTYSNVANGLNY